MRKLQLLMLSVAVYLEQLSVLSVYLLLHIVTPDLYLCCLPVTDLQFSQTLLGRPVPFGTAGDCYSAAKCPQVGEIHYNLIEMFRVSVLSHVSVSGQEDKEGTSLPNVSCNYSLTVGGKHNNLCGVPT